VVVVEKELLPHVPPVLEHVLRWLNPNIVADYDDAIFANYQNNPLLKRKIPTVIKLSKAINAGNHRLADYARKFNPNVNLIPTVVDLSKYNPKGSYEISGDKVVIGWIGTPITSKYLSLIQDALSRLSRKYPLILRCIGTSPDFAIPGVETENIKWEESTEVENIRTFDIGIMPLTDDPFSRGKCGLKLIQYMACGIPSIVSPVGVNKDIICDGENGLLAGSEEEWVDQITLLIQDRHLRKRMGMKGRQTVIERYSLEVVAPKLLAIYEKVAQGTK
jgi:glycosyltransferase involved in cell wall biosynthesis